MPVSHFVTRKSKRTHHILSGQFNKTSNCYCFTKVIHKWLWRVCVCVHVCVAWQWEMQWLLVVSGPDLDVWEVASRFIHRCPCMVGENVSTVKKTPCVRVIKTIVGTLRSPRNAHLTVSGPEPEVLRRLCHRGRGDLPTDPCRWLSPAPSL